MLRGKHHFELIIGWLLHAYHAHAQQYDSFRYVVPLLNLPQLSCTTRRNAFHH